MKQLLNKKNLFVLLFLTAVCTILPANIAKADTSGYFTYSYNSSSKTATITKYTGDEINCVIPKSLGGYKVTKIDNYAFKDKNNEFSRFLNIMFLICLSKLNRATISLKFAPSL